MTNIEKNQKPIIDFIPAEYRTGKICYINYAVIKPGTNKLHRKKIRLNTILQPAERKKFARKLVAEINYKLYNGWNPFLELEAPRGCTRLKLALETFLAYKLKELRKDSIRTYKSYISVLNEYLEINKISEIYILNFDKLQVNNFLNYLYLERNLKPAKYNSYIGFYRNVWNWFVENSYSKTNIFAASKKKKEGKKSRKPIPAEIRQEISEYLQATNYEFYLCSLLVYYTLLRPKEILMLKFSDFKLSENIINVPSEVAKNKNNRLISIADFLNEKLKSHFEKYSNNDLYVFSENLKPGKKLQDSRILTRYWDTLRNELKFSKDYQLYSLRDTGIIDLIRTGLPLDQVAQHADHSSLEITSIYALHATKKANKDIVSNTMQF